MHFGTVGDLSAPNERCGDCAATFNNTIYSLTANTSPGASNHPPLSCTGGISAASRYAFGNPSPDNMYCLWYTNFIGCNDPAGPYQGFPILVNYFLSAFFGTFLPTGQTVLVLEILVSHSLFGLFGAFPLGTWISTETVNLADGQLDSFRCGNTYHMNLLTTDYSGSGCKGRDCDWSATVMTITSVAP